MNRQQRRQAAIDGRPGLPPAPPTPGTPEYRRWYYQQFIGPGLATGSYTPILPRHGIYLFAQNRRGGRFARLFCETWARLPLGSRRRMLRHWRSNPFAAIQPFRPTVEILSDWSERRGRGLKGEKARAAFCGHKLQFHEGIVRRYPDDLVCDLIAHELAHVEQWALGWQVDAEPVYDVEEDADFRVEWWGFSATAMDAFDLANGITRVIDVSHLDADAQRRAIARHWGRVLRDGR